MFVDGQKMVGSELQQSKLQNCIQEELYLHIVGYSCVNFADSMTAPPEGEPLAGRATFA